jgi:hypothetical protein
MRSRSLPGREWPRNFRTRASRQEHTGARAGLAIKASHEPRTHEARAKVRTKKVRARRVWCFIGATRSLDFLRRRARFTCCPLSKSVRAWQGSSCSWSHAVNPARDEAPDQDETITKRQASHGASRRRARRAGARETRSRGFEGFREARLDPLLKCRLRADEQHVA